MSNEFNDQMNVEQKNSIHSYSMKQRQCIVQEAALQEHAALHVRLDSHDLTKCSGSVRKDGTYKTSCMPVFFTVKYTKVIEKDNDANYKYMDGNACGDAAAAIAVTYRGTDSFCTDAGVEWGLPWKFFALIAQPAYFVRVLISPTDSFCWGHDLPISRT